MVSGVRPVVTGLGVAASFVIGLAAVMRMAGPAGGVDQTTGVIRLPAPVTASIAALFALAAAVMLAHLVRRMRSRRPTDDVEGAAGVEPQRVPAWVRAVRQMLSLGYFVLLAYLLSRGGISLDAIMALGAGAGVAGGIGALGAAAHNAPPLVTWSFGILAVAAGLGALALAMWVALGARSLARPDDRADDARAPLEAAVEEGAEDLRTEPDARRAIVRCYARFERAAADAGLPRKPWATPMEFMAEALRRTPLARTAVPVLTALFELARFSHHPLGVPERDRALTALEEIRAAMASADSPADPPGTLDAATR